MPFQNRFVRSREEERGKEGSGPPGSRPAQPWDTGPPLRVPIRHRQTDRDTRSGPRSSPRSGPHSGVGLAAPSALLLASHLDLRLAGPHHQPLCYPFPLQPLAASSKFPIIFNIRFRGLTPPGSLPRFVFLTPTSSFSLLPLFPQLSTGPKARAQRGRGSWCLYPSAPRTESL